MSAMLDAALQYAARGWHVIPLTRKKTALTKWAKTPFPTNDQIEAWWTRWPRANVGILTGKRSHLGVLDVDGAAGLDTLRQLVAETGLNREVLRATLQASSGRVNGGHHFYFVLNTEIRNSSDAGLDFRGDGGLVVAPPSVHASGTIYRWIDAATLPLPLPAELAAWLVGRTSGSRAGSTRRAAPGLQLPPHLAGRATRDLSGAAAIAEPAPIEDINGALALIPNPDLGWDAWNDVIMAIWASCGGTGAGLEAAHAWSRKSRKYDATATDARWREIATCPPTSLTFGSLVWRARAVAADWTPPSQESREAPIADESEGAEKQSDPADQTEPNGHHFPFEAIAEQKSLNPLVELNQKYAVIGDLGGKCLVLGWVPSKVDEQVKIPSFQSFKSFAERYGNRYVVVKNINKNGETTEKFEQLGSHWLKWPRRKSYEGIDLDPCGNEILTNGYLNLWRGFAVEPKAGSWDRLKWHIGHILAAGDAEAALYIMRFAAWAVQHPGERAEVALVFRGGKGSGKGTFANALKRLFGAHGLQIFSSKHLVGAFNGHLRACLLLFADEAFWAGDKQGESVLKGMLTEPTLMIEQKGIDAAPWKNRLHVIMSANADWVVPASHDERRYAMFNVSDTRIGDRAYFDVLHAEINAGGLAAMLHDLQRVDLGDWHPRQVIHTEALREQKERSLDPKHEWWEDLLQGGILPPGADKDGYIPASTLYRQARDRVPKLREASDTALGRFLRDVKAVNKHKTMGNYWKLPALIEARMWWTKKFDEWHWQNEYKEWLGLPGNPSTLP